MTDDTTPRDDPNEGTPPPPKGRSTSERDLDDWLDEALAQTFPASDPVATAPDTLL